MDIDWTARIHQMSYGVAAILLTTALTIAAALLIHDWRSERQHRGSTHLPDGTKLPRGLRFVEIQVSPIDPGKTYALRTTRPLTQEHAEHIAKTWRDATKTKAVILDGIEFIEPLS